MGRALVPCKAARGVSPSPTGALLSLHQRWTMRSVEHLSHRQALRSNQLDLLQLPGSEEQCCCRAPGCAHPLLESSPPQGQVAGGSHLGCGGTAASGLSVALVAC